MREMTRESGQTWRTVWRSRIGENRHEEQTHLPEDNASVPVAGAKRTRRARLLYKVDSDRDGIALGVSMVWASSAYGATMRSPLPLRKTVKRSRGEDIVAS